MRVNTIDGLPIINAKRPVKLSVTPRDISGAMAEMEEPGACAAARACKRMLNAKEARVHIGRVYIRYADAPSSWVRYETPDSLRFEIVAFDRGGEMLPGEYVLRPPRPSKRRNGRQGTSTNENLSRKKRRAPQHMKNVRLSPAAANID